MKKYAATHVANWIVISVSMNVQNGREGLETIFEGETRSRHQ